MKILTILILSASTNIMAHGVGNDFVSNAQSNYYHQYGKTAQKPQKP